MKVLAIEEIKEGSNTIGGTRIKLSLPTDS